MAQRVRRPDLVDGIIDNSKIENFTITVGKIRTLDAGDSTGINAETLPFGHGSATPTIADKINSIVGGGDWYIDKWVGNGVDDEFATAHIPDPTAPYFLFVNGQQQREGAMYDFTLPPALAFVYFNYIPESGLAIEFIYQKI